MSFRQLALAAAVVAGIAAACFRAPTESVGDLGPLFDDGGSGGCSPCSASDAGSDAGGAVGTDGGNTSCSLPSGARSWTSCPAVVQVDASVDLYALGDVHGDYDRLAALLNAAGLANLPATPAGAQWTGGSAVLVCTGDLIDKWTQGLSVIAYLKALADSAAVGGGRVIVTMGNHEAEFLADPTILKAAEFVAELNAVGIAPADVAAGLHPVGQYLRALPLGARVNDWFFSHAGNSAGASLSALASQIQSGVDLSGFGAPVLSAPDSLLEARLSPSPWWELPGQDPATVLLGYAQALGVRHLVLGHQPGKVLFSDGTLRSKGVVYQKFGEVFLIDAGMSRGVDYSTGALLRMRKQGAQTSVVVIDATGLASPLWQG